MATLYQLKITLNHTKPAIWRCVKVNSTITLPKLHKVIQTVMGWEDYHLHQFEIGRDIRYGQVNPEWDNYGTLDERRVKLNTLLIAPKDTLTYTYDFGDSWKHTVLLEKTLEESATPAYPECIEGKMACPPEDCGGVSGYEQLLDTLSDPTHEDYEETIEWLGEGFSPAAFDLQFINQQLKRIK